MRCPEDETIPYTIENVPIPRGSRYWREILYDVRNEWLTEQFFDSMLPLPNFIGVMYTYELIDKVDFEQLAEEVLNFYYHQKKCTICLNEIQVMFICKNILYLKYESPLYAFFN